MKKSNVSYDMLLNFDDLEKTYKIIKLKTKHKKKLVPYELFLSINLINLYNELENYKYKHQAYNIFLIKDPKYRIIMSEKINDRIVNLLVTNKILIPSLEPKLIDSNTATRIGRGTSYAFKLCKKYLNELKRKKQEIYILKFDISKYFYNIDHNILLLELSKIIQDKNLMDLLKQIIESTDYDYVNNDIKKVVQREINRLLTNPTKESYLRIEELKKIPIYKKGKGLAIGNVTSQILAIFYLNNLDHFIKEKLNCKYYIRYMDDGIILSTNKERLFFIKEEIKKELELIGLSLNKKTNIYKISSGFSFLGYRFILKNNHIITRISNVTKNRMKKKYHNLRLYDEEKLIRVMASYNGYLNFANANQLRFALMKNNDTRWKNVMKSKNIHAKNVINGWRFIKSRPFYIVFIY